MNKRESGRPKRVSLKGKNGPAITAFIVWCVALYAVFSSPSHSGWADLQARYTQLSAKNGLLIVMMPIFSLVLAGIASSNQKAQLIFWRIKNPLPAHRAFTKLAPKDPRINMAELRAKLGNLPRAAKDQNSLWYGIYKQHQTAVTVEDPHRSFLLARDTATIALIFTLGGSVGLCFAKPGAATIVCYALAMFVQYLILALVSRNFANRMVCNVLAEHVSNN